MALFTSRLTFRPLLRIRMGCNGQGTAIPSSSACLGIRGKPLRQRWPTVIVQGCTGASMPGQTRFPSS